MTGTLGDHPLSIRETTLTAHIAPKSDDLTETALFWSLAIESTYDFEHESGIYPDSVDVYLEALPFPEHLRDWRELKGQVIHWTDPHEVDRYGASPLFYFGGHHDIERGTILFLERDWARFRVTWEGTTNSYGAFSFDVWAEFQGVEILPRFMGRAKPIEFLGRYLDPGGFVQEPEFTFPPMAVLFKPKLD